jgi:4-amino-4-deoxy-L-arabinose transferase-like glycosyltransferase
MNTLKPVWPGRHKVLKYVKNNSLLIAIMLAGLFLRLFQLGDDCLRFDEVGVSYVIHINSWKEFVHLVQSHVMAMPLDYAVTWLISRIGAGNAILRLPSALWGTLTIPVCYLLFKEMTDKKTALFSVLLLALSPFHIQYSQELRFYASLVFFYSLSTLTLWHALKSNDIRHWNIFCISMVIGVFFHMYVLLVLVNAGFFFLFADGIRERRKTLFRPLAVSTIVIMAAFAVGFLLFSGRITFTNPMLEYNISFIQSLFIGLGWLPFYFESPEPGWIWGIACCMLEISTLIVWMKKPRTPAALLLFSAIVQMALIVGLDLYKQYFYSPRQFLPFIPILMFAAGNSLSKLDDFLNRIFTSAIHKKTLAPVITTILVLVIISLNIPALTLYFNSSKGNADQITEYIHSSWKPGSIVLVVTPFYGTYYDYFFSDVIKDPAIIPSVWQADWDDVNQSKSWPGRTYVIAPLELLANQQDITVAGHYKLAPLEYPPSRNTQQLWIRN